MPKHTERLLNPMVPPDAEDDIRMVRVFKAISLGLAVYIAVLALGAVFVFVNKTGSAIAISIMLLLLITKVLQNRQPRPRGGLLNG